MTDSITKLADSYFNYLARCFPVMCASDEFHFLPRAQAAADYYDRLDNLASQAIEAVAAKLNEFMDAFSRSRDQVDHLEDRIDLELLQANATGISIELSQKQSWRYNPLLYLKIGFIGLDHALNKPADDRQVRLDRVMSRLAAIPGLFSQATENINTIPRTYYHGFRSMLVDCRQYLDQVGDDLLAATSGKTAQLMSTQLQNAVAALDTLGDDLQRVPVEPDERFATATLNETLRDHFLNRRTVDDIYLLAVEDWHKNLEKLKALQSSIDPESTWQELYHDYLPLDVQDQDTISIYLQEIDRLRQFFQQQGFSPLDLNRPVEVSQTPLYLKSVRGAASFAAAFTADEREKSYFYITTDLPGTRPGQAGSLLKKRFHREFKMLTAHETIPGHHFLDAIRCRLKNPVRRQIESPLFYEGWASYAELMLVDTGYIHRPMDLLVDHKRRLWRSARCQVDVGLATGKIFNRDAIGLLEVCGFSTEEAQRQIDRFRLNPGYQLCYSLGCHEFRQLKALWGRQMSEMDFHSFLLQGGELPFHLIRERLNYSSLKSK